MYLEFKERILYCPSIVDPSDILTFILVAENVFMVDFILSKVDSIKGVKNTNLYILTKLQFCNDWIIREIDEIITTTTTLVYIHKKTGFIGSVNKYAVYEAVSDGFINFILISQLNRRSNSQIRVKNQPRSSPYILQM